MFFNLTRMDQLSQDFAVSAVLTMEAVERKTGIVQDQIVLNAYFNTVSVTRDYFFDIIHYAQSLTLYVLL